MKSQKFIEFCSALGIETGNYYGRREKYVYAIIKNAEDFEKLEPIIDDKSSFDATLEKIYYEHNNRKFFRSSFREYKCKKVAQELAEEIAHDLDDDESEIMKNEPEHIEARDRLYSMVSRFDSESDEDYHERVCKFQHEHSEKYRDIDWFSPPYVTVPGYYDEQGQLLLSDSQIEEGIWSFKFDIYWTKFAAVICDVSDENDLEDDEDKEINNDHKQKMSSAEFKTIRESLGITCSWIGLIFGVKTRTVQYWEEGRLSVPDAAKDYLLKIDAGIDAIVEDEIEKIDKDNSKFDKSLKKISLLSYKSTDDFWKFEVNERNKKIFGSVPAATHGEMIARLRRQLISRNIKVSIKYMDTKEYFEWLADRDDCENLRSAWASI